MLTKSFARRAFALMLPLVALTVAPLYGQTPFEHQGFDRLHPSNSALPNEQVDRASGTLTVVGTDLVLPGNAGFDLVIQRIYNSSVFPDYDEEGSTALEEDSWAGARW